MTIVSDYVSECISLGISDYEGICNRAKERIKEIDVELIEADKLRAEKLTLTQVLRELRDDSIKRNRTTPDAPEIDLDDGCGDDCDGSCGCKE